MAAARSTSDVHRFSPLRRQRPSPRHAGLASPLFPGPAATVFGDDVEVLTVVGPDGQPLSSVLSFYFRDEIAFITPATIFPPGILRPTTSNIGN